MNVLVDTSDEVPIICVARFIGELNQGNQQRTELADSPAKLFVSSCEALMEQGAWTTLLQEMLERSGALFSKAGEADAECSFLVMSNIVSKLPEKEALAAAEAIATKIAGETSNSSLRLKFLLSLFNMVEYPAGKYTVFTHVLRYAQSAQVAELLLPSIKKVETWVKDWGLSNDESRAVYLAVANLCSGQSSASKEHLHYLVKYLSTFESTEFSLDTVRDEVVRAAVEFISAPDVFQCDMLDMVSVQKLQGDAALGPLFTLLSLMLTGKLADYLSFQKANTQLISKLNLSHDDIVTKMRLMSLAALGSESQSGEIPYALVKDTLQINDDEVETWVVRAISLKLLEAKIDQLREMVVFSRCTQRVFGEAQWLDLQSKLQQWKVNMGSVCKMLHNTRMSGLAVEN